NVLTQELLSHEQSACGRGGIVRFRGEREKQTFAQNARAPGVGRERNPVKILCRGLNSVDAGQFLVYMSVVGGKQGHEVLIVPDQVRNEDTRLLGHCGGRRTRIQREFASVLAGGYETVESEPLAYVFVKRFAGPRTFEHPASLLFHALPGGK